MDNRRKKQFLEVVMQWEGELTAGSLESLDVFPIFRMVTDPDSASLHQGYNGRLANQPF